MSLLQTCNHRATTPRKWRLGFGSIWEDVCWSISDDASLFTQYDIEPLAVVGATDEQDLTNISQVSHPSLLFSPHIKTVLINLYSPSSLVMDQRSSAYVNREHVYGKGHQQVITSYCPKLPLSSCVSGSKETILNASSSSLDEHPRVGRKATCDSTICLRFTPSLSSFDPGWRLYLSFGVLSIVGLTASLDATSIGPALPVSLSIVIIKLLVNISDRSLHRLSTALPLQPFGRAPPFVSPQLSFSPAMLHFLPYLAGSPFSLRHWSSSQLAQ